MRPSRTSPGFRCWEGLTHPMGGQSLYQGPRQQTGPPLGSSLRPLAGHLQPFLGQLHNRVQAPPSPLRLHSPPSWVVIKWVQAHQGQTQPSVIRHMGYNFAGSSFLALMLGSQTFREVDLISGGHVSPVLVSAVLGAQSPGCLVMAQ